MQTTIKPLNQYALVVRLLLDNYDRGVTMVEAMRDNFHKYQTRQLELEKSLGSDGKPRHLKLKIRRLPITKKNRFGHTSTFTNYKSLASKTYLINLLNSLNKKGLKK